MTNPTTHKRERSCICCGAKAGKQELLRIVRTAAGGVAFDPTGKAAGRGAYVCSAACLENATPARLARALKTNISADEASSLIDAVKAFNAQLKVGMR